MNDCLAIFFSSNGGSTPQVREDKNITRLKNEIEVRRQDLRHAQISVGVSKAAVAEAYRTHGRTSQAFLLAVTKLRREQMREQTCTSVLSRLEDAEHMTAMREITVSALTALKGTKLGNNDFESLYSSADDHAAIAEEAQEQVAEIAQCFSASGGDTDIDALLVELGLESPINTQPAIAQLNVDTQEADVILSVPSVPTKPLNNINDTENIKETLPTI